jgi:hypothetical protein
VAGGGGAGCRPRERGRSEEGREPPPQSPRARAHLPAGRGRVGAPDPERGTTRGGGTRVSSQQSPRASFADQDRIERVRAARGGGMAFRRLGEE